MAPKPQFYLKITHQVTSSFSMSTEDLRWKQIAQTENSEILKVLSGGVLERLSPHESLIDNSVLAKHIHHVLTNITPWHGVRQNIRSYNGI